MEPSILKWVKLKTKDGAPHPTVSAQEVASTHGVPRAVLRDYLDHECAEAEACWGLPFTLLLVISYAIVALSHDNAVDLRAVEDSLDHDILENANFAWVGPFIGHKTFDDVNSIADFWSWMHKGLLPLVFIQSRQFSENYLVTTSSDIHPASGGALNDQQKQDYFEAEEDLPRGFWLHYNRIVGGIRLVQERSGEGRDSEECNTLEELLPIYDLKCVFGLGYELDVEMRTARKTTDPEREVWLYAFESYDKLEQQVWDLERSRWLDRHTRKIEIAIPVYNAEVGVHSMLYVNLFFSRGGHIWKKMIPLSTYAKWHPTAWYWVGDFVWLICILYIFVTELAEIYGVVKRGGMGAIKSEYIGFWNAFDWISMACAFALIGMFIGALALIAEVNASLEETPGVDNFGDNTTAYQEAVEKHALTLENCVAYIHTFRICMASYPLIIILRLFKAYASQPRLAMVTKTLENAGQDLQHFGLVFSSVFITFTISGVVLFGREVESFGTFDRAMLACFRILMGDLMWDETSKVGRQMALLWTFLYMVVVVMLLINMLLAIIMEHYVTVKDMAGVAQPLWEEGWEVWVRMWQVHRGECVALDKVLLSLVQEERQEQAKREEMLEDEDAEERIDELDEETDPLGRILFVEDLQKIYQDQMSGELPYNQAVDLLESAIKRFYSQNHGDVDMDEVMTLTRRVDFRTTKLNRLSKQYDLQKSCGDEVAALEELVKNMEDYTDELRQEREVKRREIDELRHMKHGLLLQLQLRQAEIDPNAASVGAVLSQGEPVRFDWQLGKRSVEKRFNLEGRAPATRGGGVGLAEEADMDASAAPRLFIDPLDSISPSQGHGEAARGPSRPVQQSLVDDDPISDEEDEEEETRV